MPRPRMADSEISCRTCGFENDGVCHRYPPQMVSVGDLHPLPYQPPVEPDDWCAEWEVVDTAT